MKKLIPAFILILIALSIAACTDNNAILERADKMMESKPDSALFLLESLKAHKFFKSSESALFALLYSQALDKNDIKIESDSLISIATNYYDEKEPTRAAFSWLYQARCANNRGDAAAQASALLKAQDFAEKSENFKAKALIFADKAGMYRIQQNYDSSIIYYKKTFVTLEILSDSINSLISLIQIGYSFQFIENLDSAAHYYLIAQKQANQITNKLLLSSIYRSLGSVYFQKHEFVKSINYLHKAPFTNLPLHDSNKWYMLACVYVKMCKIDSARFYLNKITDISDVATDYFRQWQKIYELEGNSAKALKYAKKINLVNDSLYKRKLDISFAGLEKKYKFQSLQINNQKLIIKNKQNGIIIFIVLFILSLMVIIVLFWRNRVKNHELKMKQQLLTKEQENGILLELQVKMQNILLSNVEQYKKNSIKRPEKTDSKKSGISPILNTSFHNELIATMDIQYNNISKRLIEKFPDLTERDILICTLLLADFDSGMIATILNIKIESIKTHRTRLRKKLELDNSEKLIDFLRHL
jgi:DNA-binding CsgD family transcriptional regulator